MLVVYLTGIKKRKALSNTIENDQCSFSQIIYNYYKQTAYVDTGHGASFRSTAQVLGLAGCDCPETPLHQIYWLNPVKDQQVIWNSTQTQLRMQQALKS